MCAESEPFQVGMHHAQGDWHPAPKRLFRVPGPKPAWEIGAAAALAFWQRLSLSCRHRDRVPALPAVPAQVTDKILALSRSSVTIQRGLKIKVYETDL